MATWREQRRTNWSHAHDPKFTDIHPEQKPAMTGASAGEHALFVMAGEHEASLAQHGYSWATHNSQHPIPFRASVGIFKTGSAAASEFSQAVNFSGGVRQGHTFTSDPASGVGRASVEGQAHLATQGQGSGETFRVRQHRRWAGNGG